jgi:F-type H+-transporting ATPase subunit b
MQMDWTTFTLEIVNFLVLVWLLRRFFYGPVLAILDARQARVQGIKAEAEAVRRDALALKAHYESRLADWDAEREAARQGLKQELSQERAARLLELKRLLADEEAKARARDRAQATARETLQRRRCVAEAYGAVAALLERLASPALTARIAQVFREDLEALAGPDRAALLQAVAALIEQEMVEIASAHPLDEGERAALCAALARAAGQALAVSFREVPELVGGLRVALGQCQLDANLAHELAFFQRTSPLAGAAPTESVASPEPATAPDPAAPPDRTAASDRREPPGPVEGQGPEPAISAVPDRV